MNYKRSFAELKESVSDILSTAHKTQGEAYAKMLMFELHVAQQARLTRIAIELAQAGELTDERLIAIVEAIAMLCAEQSEAMALACGFDESRYEDIMNSVEQIMHRIDGSDYK